MPKIGELLSSGRAFVAQRWGTIILAAVGAPLLVSVLSSVLQKALEDSPLATIVSHATFALSLIVSLGAKRITLDLIDGKDAQSGDIFS